MADLHVGSLVEHPCVPGIGRVGAIDGPNVRIHCFASVAAPVVESRWVAYTECRSAKLLVQTRVCWRDSDTGTWRAGRIVGGDAAHCLVRLPNSELDFQVSENQLRVRWDRPVSNPVDVLIAGANETAYYRDARLPMLQSLVYRRATSGRASALLSSAVEIFPHQVHAALTVHSDPVQRYLLADEVGPAGREQRGIRRAMQDPRRGTELRRTRSRSSNGPRRRQWLDWNRRDACGHAMAESVIRLFRDRTDQIARTLSHRGAGPTRHPGVPKLAQPLAAL